MAIRATVNLTKVNASVTSEFLQAGIQYTLHNATGIWTDPDSNNRMPKDVYSLSDVQFTLLEKNFTETVTLPDVAGLQTALPKTEILTMLETFVKVVSYNRTVTDAFTLDDAALIDKDYFGNKGNIFGVTDILGLTYNKKITDSYTFSDVINVALLFERDYTETLTLDELTELGLTKPFIETPLVVSDVDVLGIDKPVLELLTLNETTGLALNKAFYERIDVVDDTVWKGGINSHVLNSKTLNGKANVYLGPSAINKHPGLEDTETLSLAEITALGNTKGITDIANIDDISITHIRTNKGELLPLGDIAATSVGKDETDDLSVSDTSYKGLTKTPNNSFNIDDILATNLSKNITDAFTLDDSALVDKDFYGNKGNIVSVTDVVTVTRVARKLLNGATFNRTHIN